MSTDVRIELDADASIDYLDGEAIIDAPGLRIVLGPVALANLLREVAVPA